MEKNKKSISRRSFTKLSAAGLGSIPLMGFDNSLLNFPADAKDGIQINLFSKHLQRVAVEKCPEGAVLVIDSRKNARAASAGSILATRLLVRGVAGMVTDGGFRDSAEIADLDIPAYHKRPSAPTNLTLHQAIAINDPIGCGDVAVFRGIL